MNQLDWSKVGLLALDFDGVLTDGKVIVGTDGVESVICSHADGQGKDRLIRVGVPMVIISTQKSEYVARRGQKLGIDCFHAVTDKVKELREYLAAHHPGLSLDQVCFMGDDHSDLEVMKMVGFPVAPANATDEIKAVAKYVTFRCGGDGSVREVCELIIAARTGTQSDYRSGKMVLITGTGERTTPETATAVEETAYRLALAGHTILTNSGRNGVPEAAAKGVKRAISERGIGRSIAYGYMPDLTAEACDTSEIRHFDSYEMRNGAVCRDADAAVFFQGGFGTVAKLFLLLQRVTHINGLLESKNLGRLAKPKQIIIHDSFVGTPDELFQLLGKTAGDKHLRSLSIAKTPAEIAELVG